MTDRFFVSNNSLPETEVVHTDDHQLTTEGVQATQEVPAVTNPDVQPQVAEKHNRMKIYGLLGAAAVLLAVATGAGFIGYKLSDNGHSSSSHSQSALFSSKNFNESCVSPNLKSSEFPGHPNQLLAHLSELQNVNTAVDAANYIEGLFVKGNLGGSGLDTESTGAINALIAYPATTKGYQAELNYSQRYQDVVSQIGESAQQSDHVKAVDAAAEFCKANLDVLSQVTNYNPTNAISRGTLYRAIERGPNQQIVISNYNAPKDYPGIVFEVGPDSGLNGFYKVILVTGPNATGNLYVQGPIPVKGNNGSGKEGTQNTQAFQGTGNNQGVSKGKTPESNPNGPNQGPGAGPNGAGTTPEAGPGQGNTPGTGGNQGGGGETTTTVTSSTVPVTTTIPTSTTTQPPTTTTQPIKTGLPTSTTTIPTGNPFNPSIRIESHSVNVRSISY